MKKLIFIFIFANITFSALSQYSITIYKDEISAYNENKIMPIASLTKLMNVITALDILKEKNISLDTEIIIDRKVLDIKESGINFKLNDKIKIRDLLKAQLVYSANNASYAIAYNLGGLDYFVYRMNKKAKDLNMLDTTFYTPAGLPTHYTNMPLDISTAKDLYLLTIEALKNEMIIKWASSEFFEYNNIKYQNRNKLLNNQGNYGLKTGYHSLAGFNMIAVSKVKGIDLISISLADDSEKDRINTQLEMIKNFDNSIKKYISKDSLYGNIYVKDSKEKSITAIFADDFYYYTDNIIIKEKINNLTGNININDKVGEVSFYTSENKHIKTIDLLAKTSTRKLNFFEKMFSLWYNLW